ncbi:hypothetical protein A5663_08445 [Mycobacterium sp. E740]|nr:hypothetical protein A5663_08445 [Mycobacterium sp. E740]
MRAVGHQERDQDFRCVVEDPAAIDATFDRVGGPPVRAQIGAPLVSHPIEQRASSGRILYDAPEVLVPFLVPDGAHTYPDAERTAAEHTMFTVAVGAAVQALLVALAVRGVGSCWIGSTIFAADVVRAELDLPDDWEPLGAVAIGYPDGGQPIDPRSPFPTDGLLVRK